jgi:hypothetical protein
MIEKVMSAWVDAENINYTSGHVYCFESSETPYSFFYVRYGMPQKSRVLPSKAGLALGVAASLQLQQTFLFAHFNMCDKDGRSSIFCAIKSFTGICT